MVKGKKRGAYKKRPDTKMRRVAMQALAMRATGMSEEDIAAAFRLTKRTVQGYIYEAGREGLLDGILHDPKDRVELKLVNKALDRIDEAMESDRINMQTGMDVKTTVALKVAEGTIWKQFEPRPTAPQNTNVVAIKIEMPTGGPMPVREGTLGGTPAYIDTEPV
jgi:hypothetical protein